MKTADQERPKHTIPAVCKAMELLGLLAEEQGETTTKALALRLGVPRTTCYRLLRSLISRDWVRPLPGGGHAISIGLLPLLQPLREVESLAEAVQPVLDALALRSSLTAKVSVRQGDYAITVARCESPQATSIAVRVGALLPPRPGILGDSAAERAEPTGDGRSLAAGPRGMLDAPGAGRRAPPTGRTSQPGLVRRPGLLPPELSCGFHAAAGPSREHHRGDHHHRIPAGSVRQESGEFRAAARRGGQAGGEEIAAARARTVGARQG